MKIILDLPEDLIDQVKENCYDGVNNVLPIEIEVDANGQIVDVIAYQYALGIPVEHELIE